MKIIIIYLSYIVIIFLLKIQIIYYLYEIIKKVNGKSLYFVWHTFDEENCNAHNLFSKQEKEKISFLIDNSSDYLSTEEFRLVHSDIHFDNVLIDENNKLKLIDFETAIYAPIDYELDIFLRMCINPLKYSSEETEELVTEEDYINIPNYLKEYYPEIFNFKYYEIRHLIYDLEANFSC